MDAVAQKICTVCGVDCSAMKRSRDAQGRYICGDCLEKARQAKVAKEGKPVVAAPGPSSGPLKVAPPALVNGVDPILNDLVGKSKSLEQTPCAGCGYPMDKGAVVCTHCGFNTMTSSRTRIAVHKAPKEKAEPSLQGRKGSNPMVFYAISLVAGLMAGGVGAYVWANMIESSGRPMRYGGMLLSIFVGAAVYYGAQGFANALTGIYAALVALSSVLVGRYLGVLAIASQLGLEIDASFFEVLPYLFDIWFMVFAVFGGAVAFKVGSSGFSR